MFVYVIMRVEFELNILGNVQQYLLFLLQEYVQLTNPVYQHTLPGEIHRN